MKEEHFLRMCSQERRFESFAKWFAKPFGESRVNALQTTIEGKSAIRRIICETISRGERAQIARSRLHFALYWRISRASLPSDCRIGRFAAGDLGRYRAHRCVGWLYCLTFQAIDITKRAAGISARIICSLFGF